MKMPAIVTSIVLLMSAITANAQSPAFTAAANGWLNGPEASNLEKLSGLANAGDTDAQILLGQIDRDTVPGGFSERMVLSESMLVPTASPEPPPAPDSMEVP